MNKRWLWILAGVAAFFVVLFSGAVAGAGITYLALQTRPARAAQDMLFDMISQDTYGDEGGVLVQHVEGDSPAAEAGIKRGDIILEADGQEVNTALDLMQVLEDKSEGDEISLLVQHCETSLEFTIELQERNGHVYLGLQPGRSRIIDVRPFTRQGDELQFGRSAFVITSVVPGSPAEDSGLEEGDFIIAVEDENFQAGDELADIIHAYDPGDTITLSVQQVGAGDVRQVTVTLSENPDVEGQAYLGLNYTRMPGLMSGVMEGERLFEFEFPEPGGGEGSPMPHMPEGFMPFMHQFPELPEGVEQAVVISSVTPGSPAEAAGLEAGDVVTAIDGEGVSDHDSFSEAILALEPGDEITLNVYRSGEDEPIEIEVTLGEHPEVDGRAYLGVNLLGFFRFEHFEPGDGSQMPFHFDFDFPWHGENWPEDHVNPEPGDEA